MTQTNQTNTVSDLDPATLKITDMRFADIDGAPKRCTLIKLYTNQGIVGYGEVRDASSRTYAAMLKSRIIGENPCNVEKIFRRIKQFGGHSRQGGGVSGIEVACWDLAGKAWGVPVWQLLGGKFRDQIRIYCDTDSEGGGRDMGKALKARMAQGFTYLKMDLGLELLIDQPGCLSAPLGFLEKMKEYKKTVFSTPGGSIDPRAMRGEAYDLFNTAHPFTGIHLTEKGLDYLEQYMADVRTEIGYEIPLAIDHLGHIPLEDCIKLAKRLEKFNLAWMEDPIPWQMTGQYTRLANATTVPIGTGEDIYLKENFIPLLKSGNLAVAHPDVLSTGGILETKKIGDMAEDYGVSMAIHMAESPIACMAAVHVAAATRNFMALEVHSVDIPWWQDLAIGLPSPLINNGYIQVPNTPGLGIEALNEELIAEKLHPDFPEAWAPTDEWAKEWANDRQWS
ncbi:mandelate racemase/muconate lactonizing enzyme family protein [Coraliomargarita parva]|uniref:mandelate racemase/muconate lactonizing enzyme family protein n=1 Tax=Coraliomargarita parva TaxID=3014050 RepID=UPI0022B48150|nr:mandelate racemase/muconate lactonizing enzyme family protein [Coraliomargarita parva]